MDEWSQSKRRVLNRGAQKRRARPAAASASAKIFFPPEHDWNFVSPNHFIFNNSHGFSKLVCTRPTDLCYPDPRLRDDCDSRHPVPYRPEAKSSAPGRNSCRWLDQPFHSSRDLAVSVDLGLLLPPRPWVSRTSSGEKQRY